MVLAGASLVYIVLSIIFTYIRLFKNIKISKKQRLFFIAILILSFSVLVYLMVPSHVDDLFRHYDLLDSYASSDSIWEFAFNESPYKFEIISTLLFSFVAIIGNYNLLPTITIVVMYLIFFYVIERYYKQFKPSFTYICLFMLTHFSVVALRWSASNIRNNLAIMLFLLALFYDTVFYCGENKLSKNKFLACVLYLLPILVHISFVIFVFLRILCLRPVYETIIRFKWVFPLWSLLGVGLEKLLFSTQIPFLMSVSAKINSYRSYDFSHYDLRIILVKSIFLVLFIIMLYTIKRWDRNKYLKLEKYYQILEIILLFMIGAVAMATMYDRTIYLIATISLPLFRDFFEATTKKTGNLFLLIIVGVSMFLFAYQFYDFSNNWLFPF